MAKQAFAAKFANNIFRVLKSIKNNLVETEHIDNAQV